MSPLFCCCLIDLLPDLVLQIKFVNEFVEFKWNSSTLLQTKVIYIQPTLNNDSLHFFFFLT